jgi:hypothetical protein
MEQLVITFGLGVAVSVGVVLFAMILKAAIMNSRSPRDFAIVDPAQLIQAAPSYEYCDLAGAIRGYDTPELFREDTVVRQQRSHERSLS